MKMRRIFQLSATRVRPSIIRHIAAAERLDDSTRVKYDAAAMNRSRLFFTCCVSLVTTSMIFAIRGDVAADMGAAFHLSDAQLGAIWSPAFWAFTVAAFATGALVDVVGL